MQTYHKINAPFKRHMSGPEKGKLMLYDWSLPEFEYLAGLDWEFTEKVDGTNIRIGFGPYATLDKDAWPDKDAMDSQYVDFGGRSDNAVIPAPLRNYLTDTFTPKRFIDAGLNGITLYGEGYGPKIQGGGKYRDDHSFVLFDVMINGFWLDRKNVDDIANKLSIDSVPVIGDGTLWDAMDLVKYGFNHAGRFLSSSWGNFAAEGIVARPVVPLFNRKGERVITKIKHVDFNYF